MLPLSLDIPPKEESYYAVHMFPSLEYQTSASPSPVEQSTPHFYPLDHRRMSEPAVLTLPNTFAPAAPDSYLPARSILHRGLSLSSLREPRPQTPPSPSSTLDSPTSPSSKTYSFVSLPGNAVKKRPRRRYDEIERLYQCSYPDCTKAYGTLNHLNAHVTMQKHGPKRSPNG
jgi:hypothetical protein